MPLTRAEGDLAGKFWNFEEIQFPLAGGVSVAEGRGIAASDALKIERKNAEEYSFQILDTFRPRSGAYRLKGSVFVEKIDVVRSVLHRRLEGPNLFAQFYLRSSDGSVFYGGGEFLAGSSKAGQWVDLEGTLLLPSNAVKVEVGIVLPRRHVGTVFFDNISLEPLNLEPELFATYRNPRSGRFPLDKDQIHLSLIVKGRTDSQLEGLRLKWSVSQEGSEPVSGQLEWKRQVTMTVPNLDPARSGKVDISLVDPQSENRPLASRQLTLKPALLDKPPYPVVALDARGRTLVDGKPFLPIGIYSGGEEDFSMPEFGDVFRADAIEKISTLFNTVLPYQLLTAYGHGSIRRPLSVRAVRQNLDLLSRNNLKCIVSLKDFNEWPTEDHRERHGWFDVTSWNGAKGVDQITRKVVESLRDHPAILGWYIHDEGPLAIIPAATRRTSIVRELDPWRPTFGVFCNSALLPEMIHLQDVIGMDPYPIQSASDRGIEMVDRETLNAQAIGVPRWDVPQMFSWGKYAYEMYQSDPARFTRKYRAPTEEETRAITLLQAIRGARGFIFYNYAGLLFEVPEAGETFERRWKEAERITSMLRDLEPFLLADLDPYEVHVRVRNGKVVAKGFRDGKGNHRILIVGVNPGRNEAEIEVADNLSVSSQYGLSKVSGGRKSWLFTGTDASSDILLGSEVPDPAVEPSKVDEEPSEKGCDKCVFTSQ